MTQISEKAHDALQRERQKAGGFLFYLLLGHVPFAALIFPFGYDTYWVGVSGAGRAALHHAVFNLCQQYNIAILGVPVKVFNYGTGWDIVTLHAFFVVFGSSILVYYALIVSSSATLSGIASETAAGVESAATVSRKILDATNAEKNRQILDELQGVLQTLLDSGRTKLQL